MSLFHFRLCSFIEDPQEKTGGQQSLILPVPLYCQSVPGNEDFRLMRTELIICTQKH